MDRKAELAEMACIAFITIHPELMKKTRLNPNYLHGDYRKAFECIASSCYERHGEISYSYDPVDFEAKCSKEFRKKVDEFIEKNNRLHPEYMKKYESSFEKYELKIIQEYVKGMKEKAAMEVARGEITSIEFNEKCESYEHLLLDSTHIDFGELYQRLSYASTPMELVRFKDLNSIMKLETTDLITIGAGPGKGKSALLLNLAADFMTNPENNVLYYNLEMNEKAITARLVCAAAAGEIKISEFSEKDEDGNFNEKITNTMKAIGIKKNFTFVEEYHDIDDIMADARSRFEAGRNNILIIDYIGLVTTKRDFKDANQTEYVMKQLRLFTKHMGFLTVIGSQLTRESTINGNESIYTFANSAEVERSSTHCLLIKDDPTADSSRLEESFAERPVMFCLVKNRSGRIADMHYIFRLESQTFTPAV